MTNKQHILETLQHRLQTLTLLAEDFSKHRFLLPEILIKTIRDTHRFHNDGISHMNGFEIMSFLKLECTEDEKTLLENIEQALRKADDYYELADSYSKEVLLSISSKLNTHLSSIAI